MTLKVSEVSCRLTHSAFYMKNRLSFPSQEVSLEKTVLAKQYVMTVQRLAWLKAQLKAQLLLMDPSGSPEEEELRCCRCGEILKVGQTIVSIEHHKNLGERGRLKGKAGHFTKRYHKECWNKMLY